MLVRTTYLPAWSIFAILPATISAFILYVLKSSPIPIGAITGMNGVASRRFTTLGSILETIPVFLKSKFLFLPSPTIFLALINPPSFPDKPTALPPWLVIRFTISLLIDPPKTISIISIDLSSVTLIPSTNSDLIPIFSR